MAWVAVDKSTVDYIVHFVYGKEVACEIDTGFY